MQVRLGWPTKFQKPLQSALSMYTGPITVECHFNDYFMRFFFFFWLRYHNSMISSSIHVDIRADSEKMSTRRIAMQDVKSLKQGCSALNIFEISTRANWYGKKRILTTGKGCIRSELNWFRTLDFFYRYNVLLFKKSRSVTYKILQFFVKF